MLYLVGILFPHINDDARSKSHQICLIPIWWFQRREQSLASVGIQNLCWTRNRIPAQTIDLSPRNFQASSGAPRGFFTRGKAAGTWRWSFTSSHCQGQKWVQLFLYYPPSPNMPLWRGQWQLYTLCHRRRKLKILSARCRDTFLQSVSFTKNLSFRAEVLAWLKSFSSVLKAPSCGSYCHILRYKTRQNSYL